MKRLLKYLLKYKALIIIPSIAMLIGMVLDMFNPYISKVLIDRVFTKNELSILPILLIGLLIISISRSLLGYVKEYLFDDLSSKVSMDIKKDLFNHIERLPYSYFDKMNTGELMSRIGEDVDNIWKTVSFGMRLFIENAAYFIIATIIIFNLNWKLAIICTIIMAPIAYFAMKIQKLAGATYEKISDQTAVINTTAQENISGVRLVKAFAREKHEILKFLELNKKNYKLSIEQTNIFAKYFPLIEFLTNLSIIIMVCIGGVLVVLKELTIGTLVAFTGYIWMLIWPMRMLGWLTNMIAQNNASAKKIFKIMDIEPEIKDKENPIRLDSIKGDIEFNNVNFKYNEEEVLKDISFKVNSGEVIAIMGPTGSGKTSIVNLIGRYYDVASGNIKVDCNDVRDICLKDLRSRMAVVAQDTFLFSDSVFNNVRMGNFDATIEDVREACTLACIDDFIMSLQDGYDTIIGERGIGLSGGQKQRISIARALIRDAAILILDDATSALDMETEYSLLKNLTLRDKKITTFIIAHRISAVKNADQIIYVEDGRIIERGNHEELLSIKGRYYDIYCDQFKEFEDIQDEVI